MKTRVFLLLLAVCIPIRLCCLISRNSYYVADEYWQSLEVAHKLVFGYGYITWEWIHSIRSYSYVSWIAVLYKFLHVLRIDNVQNLTLLPNVIQGIFTAISDVFFIAWVLKVSKSDQQAFWNVWSYMTNIFLAYCATRTLTNTIETNLTCIALYFYPWFEHKSNCKYFWFVCLAGVIRPTAVVQWAPLCFYALSECRRPLKVFFLNYIPVGVTVLTVATLIDSYLYGKWVLTWWNFLVWNVFHNISAHYSVHSVYWYFVIGLPIVLGPTIVPFYVALTSNMREILSSNTVFEKITNSVLFSLVIYSFIPHKEFRFILPLVPLMVFISSFAISKWIISLNKYQKFFLSFVILLLNVHVFYYLSKLHQVGTIKVMQYLNEPNNDLLFLMPCHLTPLYSHLHMNITTRFLRCDPNLNEEKSYIEESVQFYNDPMTWLDKEYPMTTQTKLPSHAICFDVLVPIIERFLTTRGYEKWLKIYHGDFVPPKVGNYVVVFNRTKTLNFKY